MFLYTRSQSGSLNVSRIFNSRTKIAQMLTIKYPGYRLTVTFLSAALLLTLLCILPSESVAAQAPPARAGDPPTAALISVSPPNAQGIVTVTGAQGSVPPSSQVAVRNLYTEQVAYANAGVSGSFSVSLFASGSTPFWISAAREIPNAQREIPGWMPGGPGTIVYSTVEIDSNETVTDLTMDGSLDDWAAYPDAELEPDEIFALRNRDSIYLALQNNAFSPEVSSITVTVGFEDNSAFTVTLPLTSSRRASVRQIRQINLDRGLFPVNVTVLPGVVEARLPLDIARGAAGSAAGSTTPVTSLGTARLLGVAVQNAVGVVTLNRVYDLPVPQVDESDGAVPAVARLQTEIAPFYIAGTVAQGAGYWYANGRINTLDLQPNEPLILEMDVTLVAPDLSQDAFDLTMVGDLRLQPTDASARLANNGWSSVQTPSGLAIDNLNGDIPLSQTNTQWLNITRLSDRVLFTLRFEFEIPAALPDGLYVPNFRGAVIEATGRRSSWWQNGLLGNGRGVADQPFTRLPLVFSIGDIEAPQRMPLALFYNNASDGSRGLLPTEDADRFALSNRVKFNAPTYILPPGIYPVEPYLPNQMSNTYQSPTAPLLPLNFDESSVSVEITQPDGTVNDFGTKPIVQGHLASPTVDPRDAFGAQAPVNLYRLTTLDPEVTNYDFSDYGPYAINLTAEFEDQFGHRYSGGGQYEILIAELFDLLPGVLPGTPFETTDPFYPGFRVIPGLPADVSVELRIYPLDGSDAVIQHIEGKANPYGDFIPDNDDIFALDIPGEYIVDYEARYEMSDGRLWAASLRAAGIIASPEPTLVLHGRRGIDGYDPLLEESPAWFNIRQYPREALGVTEPRFYYPYFAGDIVTYGPTRTSGIEPRLQLQDTHGAYESWLLERLPMLQDAVRLDALPLLMLSQDAADNPVMSADSLTQQSYGYISAVRPNVSVRQFVYSGDDTMLPLNWDADDPLNQQIGAGAQGGNTGDMVFLFGGAIVRNSALDLKEALIYGATGEVGLVNGDPLGARVYPPYRSSQWLPISTENGIPNAVQGTFFHLTSIHPGQVIVQGETLSIAGQTAPALQSRVSVMVTSPSGEVHQFEGLSNIIGYYFDPTTALTLDEVGVWTLQVRVSPVARTSEGEVEHAPVGGILGAVENRFAVYVTGATTPPLDWNRGGDIDTTTPAGAFFNFTLNLPPGLQDVQVYRTVTTPGYVLDDGPITPAATTFPYQYSPPRISDSFPILETEGNATGPAASDIVTVTLVVTGLDGDGQRQLYTRTFEFLTNRILSFEGES